MKRFIISAVLLACHFWVFSQTVEVEKMHELSRRSKRGYLHNVHLRENGDLDLIFITSQNRKRIKLEIYSFNKDYDLIDQREEEQEIENNKIKLRLGDKDVEIKTKYKETVVREGVTITGPLGLPPVPGAPLKLKRKRTTYTWNVFWQQYQKKVEVLEVLKPRTEDGGRYLYVSHYEDDFTGDIVVIATPNLKDEKNFKLFTIMRFNKELDLVGKKDIEFPYTMSTFYKAVINVPSPEDEDIPMTVGAFFMFAPSRWGGKDKKAPLEKANEFVVVELYTDLQNVYQVPFHAETPFWQIQQDAEYKGSWYFYGLSADIKGKYFDQIVSPKKFKSVQVMKYNYKDHRVEYINSTDLAEMKSKIKAPPSQKRKPVFQPQAFARKIMTLNEQEELFISGQNYKLSKKGATYLDVVGFYFDNKGILKAMYGVDPVENNKLAKAYGAPQYILTTSASGQNMYWILTEIDGYDSNDQRLEVYPRIAKISKSDASISDFKTLGVLNKKKFYLDEKYPFFTPAPNKITFFGSTSNGKYIYFGRVALD